MVTFRRLGRGDRVDARIDGVQVSMTGQAFVFFMELWNARGAKRCRDHMIEALWGDDVDGGPEMAGPMLGRICCLLRRALRETRFRIGNVKSTTAGASKSYGGWFLVRANRLDRVATARHGASVVAER